MAIPKFEVDMNIISKQADIPEMSTEAFKASFDRAGLLVQEYINTVLLPALDKGVDVEALLAAVLDETLSQDDKAANAKATGDALSAIERRRAAFYAKAVQSGDFAISADENFRVELINATKIRVFGGSYVAMGNLVELNHGDYVELNIGSGGTGLYRNDLICGRYRRDENGNVTTSVVLVQGTSARAGGSDPGVNTGDINSAGAVVHDTPLWRLCISGLDVEKVEPVVAWERQTVTLSVSGWSENWPYEQSVSVPGVTEETDVIVSPVPDPDENYTAYTDASVRCVSQSDGVLTFRASDVLKVDVQVNVKLNFHSSYTESPSYSSAALLSLDDTPEDNSVILSTDSGDYGVNNITAEENPSTGNYDFTVI